MSSIPNAKYIPYRQDEFVNQKAYARACYEAYGWKDMSFDVFKNLYSGVSDVDNFSDAKAECLRLFKEDNPEVYDIFMALL